MVNKLLAKPTFHFYNRIILLRGNSHEGKQYKVVFYQDDHIRSNGYVPIGKAFS